MGKLHELLAVERDLSSSSSAGIGVMRDAFRVPSLFLGKIKVVSMFDEGRERENVTTSRQPELDVKSVVRNAYTKFGRFLDCSIQKEEANTRAKADIVVDGEVIAKNMPATFLLGLESKLKAWIDTLSSIPVLPQGVDWAGPSGSGEYVSDAPVTYKTEKTPRYKVLYEATKEHPAQIEKWYEDKPVGSINSTDTATMLSRDRKEQLLARANSLLLAV
jgi:hypothetical protein